MHEFSFTTTRLILREWRDGDAAPLLDICCDPQVMEFLGPLETEESISAAIDRQRESQANFGHCYWAIERKTDSQMIGFCGLLYEPPGTPIAALPDIGWRLGRAYWGQGYAREAAQASLAWGFKNLSIEAIWAITVPANVRSWGLMERLGMERQQDMDFDHPNVVDGSPLKRHITYRIGR